MTTSAFLKHVISNSVAERVTILALISSFELELLNEADLIPGRSTKSLVKAKNQDLPQKISSVLAASAALRRHKPITVEVKPTGSEE